MKTPPNLVMAPQKNPKKEGMKTRNITKKKQEETGSKSDSSSSAASTQEPLASKELEEVVICLSLLSHFLH